MQPPTTAISQAVKWARKALVLATSGSSVGAHCLSGHPAGDTRGATKALAIARNTNCFVELYLTGKTSRPPFWAYLYRPRSKGRGPIPYQALRCAWGPSRGYGVACGPDQRTVHARAASERKSEHNSHAVSIDAGAIPCPSQPFRGRFWTKVLYWAPVWMFTHGDAWH